MRRRVIALCCFIIIFVSVVLSRVGYIALYIDSFVENTSNTYSFTIDMADVNLYYKNSELISNNVTSYVAVARPNSKCINELYKYVDYNTRKSVIKELEGGKLSIFSVDKPIEAKYIKCFKANESRYSNQLLNKQSNGLLNYIDNYVGERKIIYNVDALGRLLDGDDGKIVDENYNTKEGYYLSLDKNIQQALEQSCVGMKSGCALVMDVDSGGILASVVKPNNSYISKNIKQYAVGSVFKIVVAVSALENDLDPEYNCTGSITVGDTIFSCQGENVHNNQHIKQALANSCNCYFVNLALQLGSDRLINTARSLGFDDQIELFDKWVIKTSSLPSDEELESLGELSLLGFGQGKLMATPLQICSVLATIASGGLYNQPRLVVSNVNNEGKIISIEYPKPIQVITPSNADRMLKYMRYVVTNGTAANAESSAHKSAGKTATAQTGQYNDGIEMLNTWFAGVYPYDNPKYAMVIMTENGKSGAEDCCPIFRTMVEKLDKI